MVTRLFWIDFFLKFFLLFCNNFFMDFCSEPRRWSAADVAAWVQWARRQLQLPSVPMESFNVDGTTLASFTEEDFCHRAPQVCAENPTNIFSFQHFISYLRFFICYKNYNKKWTEKRSVENVTDLFTLLEEGKVDESEVGQIALARVPRI